MEHEFTQQIKTILRGQFGRASKDIYDKSLLLQYLNIKTRSASRGSKSRSSFANIYAVLVLVEDYVKRVLVKKQDYSNHEGAKFSALLKRQRQLPFGSKLQNHALNHRLNEEFRKFFPQAAYTPIIRDVQTNRYWFNENLLKVQVGGQSHNIAKAIVKIIQAYITAKQSAFQAFIQTCNQLNIVSKEGEASIQDFVLGLLAPNVDARIFEITSYAILKYYYHDQTVYFGFNLENIQQERLKLYKTGRTNANDGGIDFVMRPLGRFFQVTETLDVRKYFLDIDKIERYPISFVIKSDEPIEALKQKLKEGAQKQYVVNSIVQKYIGCIEEIINIPALKDRFKDVVRDGYLREVLDEIIRQSKIEFSYGDEPAGI